MYPAVFYGHFLRKNGIESLPAAVDQYTLAALTVADKFAPYYKVLQPLAALDLALPFLCGSFGHKADSRPCVPTAALMQDDAALIKMFGRLAELACGAAHAPPCWGEGGEDSAIATPLARASVCRCSVMSLWADGRLGRVPRRELLRAN